MTTRDLLWAPALLAAACFCTYTLAQDQIVHHCWIDDHGRLTGTGPIVHHQDPSSLPLGLPTFDAVTLVDNGEAQGQIDLVFMGDGFTESELDAYRAKVDRAIGWLFAVEPFASYRSKFNIHRIDVVSNESGVDGDPGGSDYDTALGMHFNCGGIDRALCVDNLLTRAIAEAHLEEADQIIVLGNSTRYGGAANIAAGIACVAGPESSVQHTIVHEFGHTMGHLGDEYEYGGPAQHSDVEPNRANLSVHDAQALIDMEHKWYRWLGESFPEFDGLVGTYEGGHYSGFGIYRPSAQSCMRTSSRPFNMPSVESLIRWMYIYSDGIETPTIFDSPLLYGHDASMELVFNHPTSHDLRVVWYLNGDTFAGNERTGFKACELQLQPGTHVVSVQAFDDTPWVRDPNIISQLTTTSRYWFVEIETYPADANGDGSINFFDISFYIEAFLNQDPGADLAEPMGQWDFFDVSAFLERYQTPCS